MVRELAVASSRSALVDDDDYDRLAGSRWSRNKDGYVMRRVSKGTSPATYIREGLHRAVMGMQEGDKRHVDHINGDPFDNRKCNLRICEAIQNWWSRKKRSDNTSGFKGVTWSKSNSKWNARIKKHGKRISLGYFETPEAAHAAYCKAADELFGEFARYE